MRPNDHFIEIIWPDLEFQQRHMPVTVHALPLSQQDRAKDMTTET